MMKAAVVAVETKEETMTRFELMALLSGSRPSFPIIRKVRMCRGSRN
jgi:hypothetical protein